MFVGARVFITTLQFACLLYPLNCLSMMHSDMLKRSQRPSTPKAVSSINMTRYAVHNQPSRATALPNQDTDSMLVTINTVSDHQQNAESNDHADQQQHGGKPTSWRYLVRLLACATSRCGHELFPVPLRDGVANICSMHLSYYQPA